MQVHLNVHNDVAIVEFDDGKKNAFTLDGLAAINTALDEAEASAKAIVLAGRPSSFCAGFDLATMTGGDREAIAALGQAGGKLATRLRSPNHWLRPVPGTRLPSALSVCWPAIPA